MRMPFYPLLILILSQIHHCSSCMSTRTVSSIPTLRNCPSCDVSTLSGSSFTPTATQTPGTAYFLRGVDPVNWCDVAQINCIPEDGSRQTVAINVIVDSVSTQLATGCAVANSVANALLCSTGNVWTYK
ncbi:hypothetical protein B9Z55_011541 [Caenorhabditis nigoni]|uniref:C6 domain-containing protein n=1 Tax=Caenorhabditis nigoni TaxID=1611254 RepID=A0A2G5UKM1_9PELO|nr:hypothetical protein B9Z55_011541 [Caenorhabditis nigoni]